MKTVRILEGFHAYPNGKRREFAAGDEPELANDFADLLVGKGLADEVKETARKGGTKPDPETA